VNADWLEELVWADVRRFLKDPGEVLERVREQMGSDGATGELETRRDELAKRLATRQAEKDRYVRLYAQGHITEDELDVYLTDLKNQADNLRLLLESVEAKLSQQQKQAELADSTEAWLYALRECVADVEEDTQEAFRARRQLVRLLVSGLTVGKRAEDGKTVVRITYRFAPLGESEGSSVAPFKNGSLSYLTNRSKSGKNLLVVTASREKEARGSPSPLPGSRSVIATFSESNSITL
jgi:multidrug resistance efflux pump